MNELEWNGMRLCLVNLDGTHSAQTHQKTLQFNYFSFHHRKHSSHFKRLVAWMRLKRLHRELAVLIWHLAIIIHNYCYYIVFTASAVRCVCVCVSFIRSRSRSRFLAQAFKLDGHSCDDCGNLSIKSKPAKTTQRDARWPFTRPPKFARDGNRLVNFHEWFLCEIV